jgi:hypothetical protein
MLVLLMKNSNGSPTILSRLHLKILKRKRGRREEARKQMKQREGKKKNIIKMTEKHWYSSYLAEQDSSLP